MAGNSSIGSTQGFSQTPVKGTLKVPVGHIILCSKWRNSELASTLQGSVNTLYEDSLGYIDFHPSSNVGVVYAAEADMAMQAGLRRKLAKLRKANKVQVLVIAEKTVSSLQYYLSLQKFVVLELGFLIMPVPSQRQAAGLLAEMVHTESKRDANPFIKKGKPPNLDECLLATIQSVPGLGAIKAKKLLEHFKSLYAINRASLEELAAVVGKASAQSVRTFFDSKPDR